MLRVLLESVVATGTFLGLYGGADAVRGFFVVVKVSFFVCVVVVVSLSLFSLSPLSLSLFDGVKVVDV